MTDEQFAHFQPMWDRPEDWVLLRSEDESVDVTLHFAGDGPTLREIIAIRQILPEWAHRPPAAVRRLLAGRSRFGFSRMPPSEADALIAKAERAGLAATVVRRHSIGCLPLGRTDDTICLIEDDTLADEVYERMIAAAVPVVDHWSPCGPRSD